MIKSFFKSLFLVLAGMLFLFSSCGVLKQTHEFERFVKCKFSVKDVQLLSVAGVDVSKLNGVSDLNYQEMFRIGTKLFTGNLPSRMRMNIEAFNKSDEVASMSGVNWLLMLKDDTLATGRVDESVRIPALAKTTFPVIVNFNMKKLIRSGSLDKILQLLINQSNRNKELQQMGLMIKLKPFYLLGGKIRKYPGYIDIRPAFRK